MKGKKKLLRSLKIVGPKKKELLQHKSEIENLEKDLVSYEYCIIHFKSHADTIVLLESKIKQIENKLNSDNLLFEQNTKEHNALDSNLKVLKTEYEKLDSVKKEIEDTLKIIEIFTSKDIINKNASRLAKGQNAVKLVMDEIVELEKLEKNLQENILQLKTQLPDVEEITKAQQWHLKYQSIKDKQNELKKENENTGVQILNAQKKLHDDLKTFNFSFLSADIQDWLQEIEVCKSKTEEEGKRIKQKIEELLVHSGLEETAKILKEGEACPLCGSEHHPAPLNSKNIAHQITQAKDKLNKNEKDIKMYGQLQQTLEKYFAGLKPLEDQKKICKNRETTIQEEISLIKSSIILKYSEESTLQKAIQQYKEVNSHIVKAETNYKKSREALSKAIKDKDRYKEGLSDIEKEIDKHRNAIEVLEKQVSSETILKYKSLTIQQITAGKELLVAKVKDTDEKYQKAQKQIDELKNKLAEFAGRIQANKKHLQEENNSLLEQKKHLDTKLNSSNFNTVHEIQTILSKPINIEDAKKKINRYSKNIQNLENEIKLLTLELGDNKYDSIKHEKLKNEILNTKEKQNHSIRLQGELQSLATDLQKKLILKKDITAQLLIFQLKSEDLNTLKKLFHSSGFVNYISSVYLQNLCSSANERFYKMTRQKLSLELNKENNFEVRDYMNGGNLRSVKTLSGGQTFQAALSLALALSDNIQSMAESNQNFFFLDEGFGSLDKESLEIVFSTLKSLRKENRIVGVISHVEEMQQEIPTYLNISQDEENGSFIEESWGR